MSMEINDEYFKKNLTDEEYNVLRKGHTEAPFTNEFYKHKEDGSYYCKACGSKLFVSDAKFDSDCGWPAFDSAVNAVKYENKPDAAVTFKEDISHGMKRTEVCCKKCGSHLGHIFDDGPTETGVRYCINSKALKFKDNKNDK